MTACCKAPPQDQPWTAGMLFVLALCLAVWYAVVRVLWKILRWFWVKSRSYKDTSFEDPFSPRNHESAPPPDSHGSGGSW